MKNDIMRYSERIEFEKIIDSVSEIAVSEDAKNKIKGIIPMTEKENVENELRLTGAVFDMLQKGGYPGISSVSGITEIAVRSRKSGILSMGELLKVRKMLRNSETLQKWYLSFGEKSEVKHLFENLYTDKTLERDIYDSILSEEEISDNASRELASVRAKISKMESSIRDKLNDIIKSGETNKYLSDSVVTMRGGRMVVPVKAEHRNAIKGLVLDVSQSGSTFFVEPEAVVETNIKIMELKAEEQREIDRVLMKFSTRVADISFELERSFYSYIHIDVLLAKAEYAFLTRSVVPKVNSDGVIKLKKARHPLIPKETVVPIDIEIGEDYDRLIVTGPNTGGKTVSLKTVGLLTLMAMSGIMIPAEEESEISVFENILVDIGDEQSIEQSLSTFSGHIKNIAEILDIANDKSLVLLDELGAGTDPAEGAALAVAILERLGEKNSKVIATTHYGELKIYATETDRVENASSEFDLKTLKPTYRLIVGMPGRSNALVIAKRLGFDDELIESAQGNMDKGRMQYEAAIEKVEKIKDELNRKKNVAEREIKKAKEAYRKAKSESDTLIEESKKEYDRAVYRSKQLMLDVEATAEKLMGELREIKNSGESDSAMKRTRDILKKDHFDVKFDRICDDISDDLLPVDKIIVGDRVFSTELSSVCEIISDVDEGGTVEILAGSLKMRVDCDSLRQLKKSETKVKNTGVLPKKQRTVTANVGRRSGNELNLIGKRLDEAMIELELFLDNAILGNQNTLYIIHGKGTGVLREGVTDFLRRHKGIKNFRQGSFGEGDSGVTVVELK
ncbi:MAG: endonuclease MutS2 [Ruminococcaceae bacterium]|nr:endonuclease MutS2 [Oscillospiraceae bacterium]